MTINADKIEFFQSGELADADQVLTNTSFALTTGLNYALDGATTTNQDNLDVDFFTSDTAAAIYNMEYDSGNDYYKTVPFDTSYYIDVEATSLTIADFAINDCQMVNTGAGTWRLTSSGTYEVQRAKCMKTLFYGTDGTDDTVSGITSLTALKSPDSRDVGKRVHYGQVSKSIDSGLTFTLDGTFVDTSTNTDCSTWSYLNATGGTGSGSLAWEMPEGTTKHSFTDESSPFTSDETSTDTSADDNDNPADCQIYANKSTGAGQTLLGRVIILCKGDVTWGVTGTPTHNEIDFFTDHSVPDFTAVTASTTFFIDITADSLTPAAFATEGCTVTQINATKWRVWNDDGTQEENRAKVFEAVFRPDTESDETSAPIITDATNVTVLGISDTADVGLQVHYIYVTHSVASGGGPFTGDTKYTGTFVDTSTNTKCSSWSDTPDTGGSNGHSQWEMPEGTTLASDAGDEYSTDLSADEKSNPADCEGRVNYAAGNGTNVMNAMVVCKGDVTWAKTTSGDSTASTAVNYDFVTDGSLPVFTISSGGQDTCVLITDTVTLASEENVILKALTTISDTSSLVIEFSADGGSNYQTITEKVLTEIVNTGTTGQVKFTITRLDSSTVEIISAYAYYYG